jgi:hypothetical protein
MRRVALVLVVFSGLLLTAGIASAHPPHYRPAPTVRHHGYGHHPHHYGRHHYGHHRHHYSPYVVPRHHYYTPYHPYGHYSYPPHVGYHSSGFSLYLGF